MIFSGQKFTPMAEVSKNCPVLVFGGIAKQFLVPGWRVGWVQVHDPTHVLDQVRSGLISMSQIVLGANSLVQSALPRIFSETSKDYYQQLNEQLESQAMQFTNRISKMEGLKVIVPQAAMYVMVQVQTEKFKDITDDVMFSQKLLQEEYVVVLPGQCFQAPNFFRVVFCASVAVINEACDRIESFVKRHLKSSTDL